MHAFRMIMPIATAMLAATLFGCAEEKPAAAPTTETTSATVEATRNQLAQMERERNDARAALAAERAAEEKERQNFTNETNLRRDYDNLQNRILQVLEQADQDMQAMHDKGAKLAPKARQAIDQVMADAHVKKAKLYEDMRKLNGDIGQPWDAFKAEVETTMTDLNRVLTTPTETKAKAPGGVEKKAAPVEKKTAPMNPKDPM